MFGIEDQFSADDWALLTRRLLAMTADGTIRPVIGQTVPLERAADAHAANEARTVSGKTLLTV